MRMMKNQNITVLQQTTAGRKSGVSERLTKFEKEVYDFIKERGEMLTSSVPIKMGGAIPNLRNEGVVEVYKETTSRWKLKKRKFVRVKDSRDDALLEER